MNHKEKAESINIFYVIFTKSGDNSLFIDSTFSNLEHVKEYLILSGVLFPNDTIKLFPINYNIDHIYFKHIGAHVNGFFVYDDTLGKNTINEISELISDYKIKKREEKINQLI